MRERFYYLDPLILIVKKLAVLLVSLLILAVGTAVALACLSDHMLSIFSNGSTFGGPGADSMKDRVVRVALDDPASA